MAPSKKVDQFCKKAKVKPIHLSNAEKKLLNRLTQDELDALAQIHTKSLTLQPVARVGSSGF